LLSINRERLIRDLQELGKIGWVEDKGLFREAYSPVYIEARDFIRQRMEEAGLHSKVDSVGNLFGLLPGRKPDAPRILTGSHLDAVKGGGIYDGAYGVIASLEALRSIRESGMELEHGLEVVAFIAEEAGPLGGTFGSRSFTGQMETPPPDEILQRYGLSRERIQAAQRPKEAYAAFIEAHIEQGPVLWQERISIGIPTGIVGITRYQCRVLGEANHAGTTPMLERKDAFYETVVLLHRWLDYMRQENDMVCNVGNFRVLPGQIGIVPGEVEFLIEIRSLETQKMERAVDKLRQILETAQTCRAEMVLTISKPPVELDETLIGIVEDVCCTYHIPTKIMASGASHDASPLARVMPAAMVFVPSVKGISHSKDEYTESEHLCLGAKVLANTIVRIDKHLG
jgi:hydantoinase/carbamoylase family amidase